MRPNIFRLFHLPPSLRNGPRPSSRLLPERRIAEGTRTPSVSIILDLGDEAMAHCATLDEARALVAEADDRCVAAAVADRERASRRRGADAARK
jgi:hypothetical protein